MTNSDGKRDSAVMMSSAIPSAKIFLLGIAAHIRERQHRDRRLVGQARRCAAATLEALAALPADTRKTCTGSAMFLTCCKPASAKAAETRVPTCSRTRRRDADAAGLGKRLQPRRDVDRVAEQIAVARDDVAAMNADAEQHAPLGRKILVLLGRSRAGWRSRRRAPSTALGNSASSRVAGGIGDAAAMLGDQRVDDRAARASARARSRPRRRASAGCTRRRRRRESSSDDARHAAASGRCRRRAVTGPRGSNTYS